MREINKLSTAKVASLKKPGLHGDGLGLYLQIAKGGSKSWLYRFMRDGQARKMGLGPVHTVTLKAARERATECRRTLLADVDPIEARKAEKLERRASEAKALTFKECAERYIAAHRSSWKNVKHSQQWTATLETYVHPTFGKLAVQAVDVGLVLKVLEPIWSTKPETATRVRGRIESVLDWATARNYRQGDNPARWRGHLDKLLPKRGKIARVRHHPALPYSELPGFMAGLRTMEGVSPKALEFCILTATRTGETVGARWPEINLAERVWIIPGTRMKAGKEHRIPLSDRAIAILESLPREANSNAVFIGDKAGSALSTVALWMTLRRMGRSDITTHGFRSTFKDWAGEQTSYANELTEMALAHVVSDKTEAAYRRGDMVAKRRHLMEAWAKFCEQPARSDDNVVSIRSAS